MNVRHQTAVRLRRSAELGCDVLTVDEGDGPVDIPLHPLSPVYWTRQQPGGPRPLRLAITDTNGNRQPGVSPTAVYQALSVPWAFFESCQGLREDDTVGYFQATGAQRRGFITSHTKRWTYEIKYRQAKKTTEKSIGNLFRDCMLFEGLHGLLIAEKTETAEDNFEKITLAYKIMKDDGLGLAMPLAPKRDAGIDSIHFSHGGNIKIITGAGFSPGVGRSLSRLHITEFGELDALKQRRMATSLFPTINKRPNARVWIETTPGKMGDHAYKMWVDALNGKGRFAGTTGTAEFLKWWHDETCREAVEADFSATLSEVERDLLARLPGCTLEHIAYRRTVIDTEMGGETRLFLSKYPTTPLDGWLGSKDPVLPEEELNALYQEGVDDNDCRFHLETGLRVLPGAGPWLDKAYLVTCDPKRSGKGGDPAAIEVWDNNGNEVAWWEGREDEQLLAQRLKAVVEWIAAEAERNGYSRPGQWRIERVGDEPLVAVESNVSGVVAVLMTEDFEDLSLYHCPTQNGWYCTEKLLRDAKSYTIIGLRQKTLTPRSRSLITQLLTYDGAHKSRRIKQKDGESHHFDRARCAVMAGHLLHECFLRPPELVELRDRGSEDYIPQAMRATLPPKKRFNPLAPQPW